jgi:hypothetical protein
MKIIASINVTIIGATTLFYIYRIFKNVKFSVFIPPLAEWWVYWNTVVRPSLNLVYVTSHLSFTGFYSAMISACAYYTDFTDGTFLREL